MAEVLHLDIYQILEKHQSLRNIQTCDFLNSEPFKKTLSCLANPSVQFSLVRCLRNFSEEESRYSCKVEVELIGHKPSVSARSNKPAEAAFYTLDLWMLPPPSDCWLIVERNCSLPT